MNNRLDSSLHELVQHGTPSFPFAYYNDPYEQFKDLYFYYHYHDEFEIVFSVSGDMSYIIDGEEITIKEGGMILINSNVLHQVCHSKYPLSKITTLVFSKIMFSLFPGSSIETKYLDNLLLQNFTCMTFDGNIKEQKEVIDTFAQTRKLIYQPERFEIGVHIAWLQALDLMNKNVEKMNFVHSKNKVDNRIRKAIDFITKSYNELIGLDDIAASINLSPSECCKLFKKNMNTSPITYLSKYRINMACALLLKKDMSITEIALETGFTSSNYFTITFKKYMKMTPREFQHYQGK